MILLLMLIVALMLAWGLTDMQLNAPIERPEPPIPVIAKPVTPPAPPEVPPAEPVLPESAEPAAETPPEAAANAEPPASPAASSGYSFDR